MVKLSTQLIEVKSEQKLVGLPKRNSAEFGVRGKAFIYEGEALDHEMVVQNSPGLQPWVTGDRRSALSVRHSLRGHRGEGGKVAADGRSRAI